MTMTPKTEVPAGDQPHTIPEFCRANRLSITSYYKLRERGQGPREMHVLSRILITPAAERDWRRERETPDKIDTQTVERLRNRGLKAGRSSVAARRRSGEVAA
jgi:hypothetical protein